MAKAKILLVDDTRLVLELEKSFLKFSRVEIVTAANGVEALELVRKDPPDLIFMDMNMPVMDGLTSMRTIRSMDAEVKLIMLTSLGGAGHIYAEAMQLNAQVVSKPFDSEQIIAAIAGF